MSYKINQLPNVIPIGVQTEHGVEEISFDVSEWQTAYGTMDFTIYATRPGEDAAYQVKNQTLVGSVLYWYPDDVDTSIQGVGKVEVLGTTGDKRKLSGWCETIVRSSTLALTQEPPGVVIPWLEDVKDAAEEAKKQADRAESIADSLTGGAVTGSVRYDKPQQLTEAQKVQARENIGAGTGNGNGDGIPEVHVGPDTPPEGAKIWVNPEAELSPEEIPGVKVEETENGVIITATSWDGVTQALIRHGETAGAIRYDEQQALTQDQQSRAQQNLGLMLLRVGDGLEIVDGVLRVTGTVTPPSPDEPEEPQMIAFVQQEDGTVLVQAVAFVPQDDGSILWDGATFIKQDDGSYLVS